MAIDFVRSLRGHPVRPPASGIARRTSFWQRMHVDPWLLGMLLVLMCSGLAVLYSASGENVHVVTAQAIRFGVAWAVMLVLAQFSPATLMRWALPAYLAGLVMLVAVEILGDVGMGAQRWLVIPGVVRFQPSEMMKIAMPMMVAAWLSRHELPPNWRALAGCALLIALPVGLIARQPDLGTSLLVAAAAVFVILLAGLSWRFIGVMVALAGAALPLLWMNMHNYQRQRVLTFLDPESDPLGAGWNIIQSTTAIGSGGVWGKGWLEGTQSQLEFLPERHTDFIVAVLGEEFGLVGMLAFLLLYLLIVARGLWLAGAAQDTFGRLLGGGIMLTFFIYVFVNIGMVSGILPVVGVPLPLVSYGGTSSVTLMAGFGILMAVNAHRRLLPR
ncbi:rod shape-determining protein RodA [Halomonas litopenaei]|uniref:Peptidoglycan glycosyltransferase MrdB n=3 Tax=Halomonas TaxID=2745 RepID=A0AAU7KD75_9GAMM|nr:MULTISPECIES: rod shape-determining protein RodA [Halomonas]MBR9772877.1 rod shape-determining protein RodA [Gammaproteobacteria bacterium]MAR72398.1 rod shape-determining protein RodA [Halomonas sp.]MAY70878.1 rod shape-determining protein RodA [Halomonas sp.]MBY5942880.1 rod shape-determining protein RodA [Halomonas sp. DP5N14-9]MBY6111404.1 rod shape-determining protein RodA [Halomonas sp. DP1Y21-3]|tara:strand:+ start:422 stop:1579 length:1158 start_codon:yes stop_codon:yes gene_type:complete